MRTIRAGLTVAAVLILAYNFLTFREGIESIQSSVSTNIKDEIGDGNSAVKDVLQWEKTHTEDEAKIGSLEKELEESRKEVKLLKLQSNGSENGNYITSEKTEDVLQWEKTHKEDEAKIGSLEKELEESRKEVKMLKLQSHGSENENYTTSEPATSVFRPNEICSHLHSQSLTTSQLWKKYLPEIMNASINPEFLADEKNDTRRELLEQVLTPSRMRRSAIHLPTFSHGIIKNVMEIVERRIQDPKKNPPLQIAVFGGSVTIGRGCLGKKKGNGGLCAWPKRLELLINQFVGMELVKIHNLGVGGTDSSVGTKIVKYWMYPDELMKFGPDVIINGGSTNDALPSYLLTPEDDYVIATADVVRNRLQPFIRTALQTKRCSTQPLVIHVDDYLGPQQKQLLGELQYISVMSQLARWYDTVAISYGELVRDVVYQNTDDPTFFNKKDVHYGRWAHQTIAWAVGFTTMNLVQNYCSDEYITRTASNTTRSIVHGSVEEVIEASKKDDAADNDESLKGSIRKHKLYLPPPLTRELLLGSATVSFDTALNDAHKSFVEYDCTNYKQEEFFSPCIVKWISTPGGFRIPQINQFLRTYATNNENWGAENQMKEGWGNKIGLATSVANSTLTLRFQKITNSVKTLTFYFMRSYGDKWKDSLVKITVSRIKENDNAEVVLENTISGVWENVNATVSLTLTETMVFEKSFMKGETFTMKVDLISGNHFKIMGIFLCDH